MERLLSDARRLKLDPFYDDLFRVITERAAFLAQPTGNFLRFKQVVEQIPDIHPRHVDLESDVIVAGDAGDISPDMRDLLKDLFKQLSPWRKGPFRIFGIDVDAEWRSDLKWQRFQDHIQPLADRRILDIGSSSGYYMFRMASQQPMMVLGLEPQSAFYFQYLALQKFLQLDQVYCLPIVFNALPMMKAYFDTVFCMGILYHRKSPIDMLTDIRNRMRPGGELVVENLVIDSNRGYCLFPQNRYAKMRNVFFIPDIACLTSWLNRAGFSRIHCIDVTPTTQAEQRQTEWIKTESLADFLDPTDPSLTVEGYPAPVRAIFTARA